MKIQDIDSIARKLLDDACNPELWEFSLRPGYNATHPSGVRVDLYLESCDWKHLGLHMPNGEHWCRPNRKLKKALFSVIKKHLVALSQAQSDEVVSSVLAVDEIEVANDRAIERWEGLLNG